MQAGYSRDVFSSGFDTKFLCNYCGNILRDPVQSYCGHRFCRACIQGLVSSGDQRVQCLQCLTEGNADEEYSFINQDQIFPDMAVKREMSSIESKCVNPGCSWKGNFKHYEAHFKECKYQASPCTQCGNLITASKLNDHMKNECQMRRVKCKHCSAEVVQQDLETTHQNECPKFPLKCDSCGKKKIPREKMQQHIDKECANQKIQCPVPACEKHITKVDRNKFQHHVEQKPGLHIVHNMEQVSVLSEKIEQIVAHLGNNESANNVGLITELRNKVQEQEQAIRTIMTTGGGGGGSGSVAGADVGNMMQKFQALEIKTGTYEGIVTTLHREIERCITAIENMERQRQQEKEQVNNDAERIKQLEAKLHMKEVIIAEHALKISNLETTVYDGNLMWRIPEWTKKRREAVSGQCTSIYSTAFYTSRSGYKMCVRLYPNGDGMGKGTHVSIFFVIMRGNYDALLGWPFGHRVIFRMIDQGQNGNHLIDSFRPDPSSTSFKRPTSEMNIASGCPLFMPLSKLDDPSVSYVKDDVMYVNVCLDISEGRRNPALDPGTGPDRSLKSK